MLFYKSITQVLRQWLRSSQIMKLERASPCMINQLIILVAPSTSETSDIQDETCHVVDNVCNPAFCRDGVSATLETLYNNADIKTHHHAVFVLVHALMLESGFCLKVPCMVIFIKQQKRQPAKVSAFSLLSLTITAYHCLPLQYNATDIASEWFEFCILL